MRVNKKHYLYLIVFLILTFFSGCSLIILRPPSYLTPPFEDKPILYIETFEDVRPSEKVGRMGCFGIFPLYTNDNESGIVTETFIDVLIKNNINALMYRASGNHIEKHDLRRNF